MRPNPWILTTTDTGDVAAELDWDWRFYRWGVVNSGQLQPTTTGEGAHEVVLSNAPPYQSGRLEIITCRQILRSTARAAAVLPMPTVSIHNSH